jgi:hypothetical protein
MATGRWPIISVDLDDLVLDVDNVRLAIDGLDEAGIATYMVEAEDLIGLVRDLLRDTYIDNELPIVIAQGDKHVVMEANRRVAALKAIAAPSILGRHTPALERLLTRYPDADTPTNVRVMVAPSREAAQPVLARLHTGQPKRSWIREQQAIFYHARLSATVTVDDLRAQYPREASKIIGFIRMGEIRELIRGLKYDDSELEDFVKTSKLKMTSLEYAYDRPKICAVLGLKFDAQGLLATKRLTADQRRGMMHLLGRFKSGTLNTRSPELKANAPEHETLVATLERIVNGQGSGGGSTSTGGNQSEVGSPSGGSSTGGDGASTGGSGTGGSGSGGSGGSSGGSGTGSGASTGGSANGSNGGAGGASAGGSGSRGPNRGSTLVQLDFSGLTYGGIHSGLRRRFEELQRINVRDFPNAAYDLLRTVLECSIKEYFDVNNLTLQAGATLGPSVNALAAHFRGNDRRMTDLINHINRSGQMQANQYAGTGSSLNASNHNAASFATQQDVHEAWDRLKPILITLVG